MIYTLYKRLRELQNKAEVKIENKFSIWRFVLCTKSPGFERSMVIKMNIIISNSSDKPIYEQITNQIKGLVMSGELKEGDALPSMRTLAKELRISVITTKRAYEDLERDGFISTVVGKGSFVKAADTRLVREERLKQIEELLSQAISLARQSAIRREEIEEMIEIIYQEE